MEVEIDASGVDFVQERDQVLQRAAEAIDAPSHHDVEFPPDRVAAQSVELWSLVPTLGARDPVISVDLHDLAVFPFGDSAQLPLLACAGLPVGADARVDGDAAV